MCIRDSSGRPSLDGLLRRVHPRRNVVSTWIMAFPKQCCCNPTSATIGFTYCRAPGNTQSEIVTRHRRDNGRAWTFRLFVSPVSATGSCDRVPEAMNHPNRQIDSHLQYGKRLLSLIHIYRLAGLHDRARHGGDARRHRIRDAEREAGEVRGIAASRPAGSRTEAHSTPGARLSFCRPTVPVAHVRARELCSRYRPEPQGLSLIHI